MRSALATLCASARQQRAVLLVGFLAATPAVLAAQDLIGTQRRQATRAELEQAVAAAEQAQTTAESKTREQLGQHVASLRQRLRNGDFAPGDRLFLTVLGDSALTDTFTVRQDQGIQFPGLPVMSLRGVLDSELTAHLTKELSRYLKNPQVTATGLIRLSVMGGIGKPGFLTVPIDQLVTDVVMASGGPAQSGKFEDAIVKRGSATYLNKRQFADAVRQGKTVGDVSLRDGDEIFIPMATNQNRLTMWLPILTAATTIYWITRGGRGRRTRTP
ncbi:MAG: polysaccharide biosynthesis/export family protein [Gemmatimonadaceae bacterium]|nr:polysaccharide biosynthesis/export family protein [Gemmatimonadaceae bacterium]